MTGVDAPKRQIDTRIRHGDYFWSNRDIAQGELLVWGFLGGYPVWSGTELFVCACVSTGKTMFSLSGHFGTMQTDILELSEGPNGHEITLQNIAPKPKI